MKSPGVKLIVLCIEGRIAERRTHAGPAPPGDRAWKLREEEAAAAVPNTLSGSCNSHSWARPKRARVALTPRPR